MLPKHFKTNGMKKILFAIALNIFFTSAFAQKISKISLTQAGDLESMFLLLDDNVTVSFTKDGSIAAWGVEVYSDRITNYSRLENYPGRVDYYTNYDNEAFRGKVKFIGRTSITYYGTYDKEEYRGKIKTIGSANFEYYSALDDEAVRGKLKNIGSSTVTWYTSFDNEAYKGKLKSIGATNIVYYGSFEDKAIRGKLKSIDRNTFVYYTSNDKTEYKGLLKTGNQFQTINGIKYYVR